MKFYSLGTKEVANGKELQPQFDAGHQIGAVCVSDEYLFFKKGLKRYVIAYREAERIFRRVRTVTANICCEGGDLRFDYLVIMQGGTELAEVQLPGQKAAQMLLEEIRAKYPEGCYEAPAREETAEAVSGAEDVHRKKKGTGV